MKLLEVLKAKEPLARLMDKNFTNYKVLRDLVKLQKAITAEVEFYTAQEKKNIALYAETDDKGQPVVLADGRLKLKDVSAKLAFETEIAKLHDTEVDGITAITIYESDFKSSAEYPKPSEMVMLEPIIKFEG